MLCDRRKRRRVADRSADLIDTLAEVLPPWAAGEQEDGFFTQWFCRAVELQEGIGDGRVVRHMQRFEDRVDLDVAHYRIRQRECNDDLDSQGGDIAVHSYVLHCIQKSQVALGILYLGRHSFFDDI